MTSEERKAARGLKAAFVKDLQQRKDALLEQYRYALTDTDQRLTDYVAAVIDDPDGHNLYEIAKIKRFFDLLGRHGWNAKRVKSKIRLYESLYFSGTNGRTRYKLTPVQTFQMAHIFGFARDDGRRLIRMAYIFVPRKFSKTTFAAFLAVDDLLFGDKNAEAYVGANSYDQAKKCFNEVRQIMFELDPGQKHFRINRELIKFKDRGRDSLVQCLTANAKTKDGLFASLAILDEYAHARNTATSNGADLKNVLTTSMGPRREPLTVVITTASDVIDGPCYHELEGVKAVLRGEVENDTVFADLFMPDADDDEGDPRTWAKVHPHLGVTVQPDFYANEWEAAKLSAENMLAFRTKLLNVFAVNEVQTWFTTEKARELVSDWNIDAARNHPDCAVAFDLSVRDDFSAVSYTMYNATDKKFYSHTDYYFPAGALKGHPNEQLYRAWNEAGHLLLCNGDKIDVRQIAEDIIRRSKKVNIIRIGYDAYKSQELVNILSSVGARDQLQAYSQTYGSFNLPVEAFEMLAYDNPPRITMNNNPINVYCLANCVIDQDRLENKKPVKITHTRKIDGTIAMLMTIGQLYKYER